MTVLERKADASDGAVFVLIVERLKLRWDTPPGESDRGVVEVMMMLCLQGAL